MSDKRIWIATGKESILYGLMPLFVAIFPVLFMYGQNAEEVNVFEVLPLLGIFGLCGILLYLFSVLIFRVPAKGTLISSLVLAVFLNYTILEKAFDLLPFALKYWEKLFFVSLLLVHFVLAVVLFCKKGLAKVLSNVFALTVGALCLINVVTAVPKMILNLQAANAVKATQLVQEGVDTSLPNFYYFIFDEMGGFPAMQDFYGYDSTNDIAFFENLGFNVSEYSFAWTGNTFIETGNLFHLKYIVNNESSVIEQDNSRKNAPFFQEMTKKGYSILGIGSTTKQDYALPMAYEVEASGSTTVDGKKLENIVLENTIYRVFMDGNQDMFTAYRAELLESLDYLKNPVHYTMGGQFYLLHVNIPHMPFVFEENGRPQTGGQSGNWVNKDIYLAQYKYALKNIKELAEAITTNDPNSIIVFQSDHGFRGGGQISSQLTPLHFFNILNMVYYQGQPLDIENKTSINTLRTILNELFDEDYEMLTPPEGMYQHEK